MAENQPQGQGGEPGYVIMTPEDVIALSKKAADEAVSRYRSQAENGDGDNLIGLDGKFVKQLQNTVGVFNALKDFSSSPLQKVVEEKVGQFAAGMVESAFSGPRSPEKKSIIDSILNSQFAYGLGVSLGNKSPELLDSMSRNLGREQTGRIIDNVITKGTQGQTQVSKGQGSQQDNVELLLSLDPNNPEHIAAYSESQGGLPPDVARKMLMIHQDAIIKRFGDQGANVQKVGAGQRAQSPPKNTRQQHAPIVDQVPNNISDIPEDSIQYTNYDEFPGERVAPKTNTTPSNIQEQSQGGSSNSEMLDVMKKFSDDIGHAMSAMIEEISTLKGTVSQLRGEIDTIRPNRPMQPGMRSPTIEQPPVAQPYVDQRYVVPPPPVSVQTKREYVPPIMPSPVVQPISNQSKVISYQPKVDPIRPIDQETIIEPIEQYTTADPMGQEPEKSLEEIMGIREHIVTVEELADIKPKNVVQQHIQQPMRSDMRLDIPTNTVSDIKWTDEDLARDIANIEKAKESNQHVSKPKNITEELIKVAEENKVIHDTGKVHGAEGTIEPNMITNVEEKRSIVPIKKSDIHRKIKPSIKKTENGVI